MSLSKKQILLINDVCGYGKVATAAMLPILSYMGMPVHNLPTAIVSNTLDYGKFNLLGHDRLYQGGVSGMEGAGLPLRRHRDGIYRVGAAGRSHRPLLP